MCFVLLFWVEKKKEYFSLRPYLQKDFISIYENWMLQFLTLVKKKRKDEWNLGQRHSLIVMAMNFDPIIKLYWDFVRNF